MSGWIQPVLELIILHLQTESHGFRECFDHGHLIKHLPKSYNAGQAVMVCSEKENNKSDTMMFTILKPKMLKNILAVSAE